MNEINRPFVSETKTPKRLRGKSHLRARAIAAAAASTAAIWLGLAPVALGRCKIEVLGEIKVDTTYNRVITQGQINSKPIRVMIDTGGTTSWLWADSAQRLGLHPTYEGRIKFYGVGGETQPSQTVIKHLQIGTMYANNMRIIVLPSTPNRPPGAPDLVLGYDTFASYDTDFDLAHGKIRLLKPVGCMLDELPYWTNTYSQADLESGSLLKQLIKARILVNGKPIEAVFDTGSPFSAITRQASAYAGVTPWVKDPQPAETIHGLGANPVPTWVGMFDSFSIGDETISHVPMRIGDLFGADTSVRLGSRIAQQISNLPTMLIGCDFFLAHHVLVASRQRKLLFTYNGGVVFQIPPSARASSAAPPSAAPPSAIAPRAPVPPPPGSAPAQGPKP